MVLHGRAFFPLSPLVRAGWLNPREKEKRSRRERRGGGEKERRREGEKERGIEERRKKREGEKEESTTPGSYSPV